MSALAGLWRLDGRPDASQACDDMLGAQRIFGPHASHSWTGGDIAIGRNLFRTVPEDIHDAQPLAGAGGRVVLVADVRLDNRADLIRALGLGEDDAKALADSAILLAAWERWAENCFDRLVGDYAFAIWDRDKRHLILARDPLGMRPLFYHRGRNFFAFASMAKGLHALPDVPRAPDEDRIVEELALLPDHGTRSFFAHIQRVMPGHYAVVTAGDERASRHWNPKRGVHRRSNHEDYAAGLREHLDQAVAAQLRGAEQVVAAQMSSGFDSSAVATSAALRMAATGGKVIAFTAVPREGYDGPDPRNRYGDEGPLAAQTAALYGNMEHVLVRTGGRSPLEALDRNFFLYERPVLNLCNLLWAQAINDAARERKLKVLLTGQMGNMTISYSGEYLMPQLMRTGRWLSWLRHASGLRRRGMRTRGLLVGTFGPYMPVPLWAWINRTFKGEQVGLETYSALAAGRISAPEFERRAKARGLDLTYRPRKDGFETRLFVLQRVDRGTYGKGTLGGWGLDVRDPTSDRRLIEFCLSTPDDAFMVNGDIKALARRAFASRLPAGIIGMRHKGYQAVDWHEGLTAARDALREEIGRLEACGPAAETIDLPRLRRLVDDWPRGGWETDAVMRPYRLALLRAISSGHFLRRASGSNA